MVHGEKSPRINSCSSKKAKLHLGTATWGLQLQRRFSLRLHGHGAPLQTILLWEVDFNIRSFIKGFILGRRKLLIGFYFTSSKKTSMWCFCRILGYRSVLPSYNSFFHLTDSVYMYSTCIDPYSKLSKLRNPSLDADIRPGYRLVLRIEGLVYFCTPIDWITVSFPKYILPFPREWYAGSQQCFTEKVGNYRKSFLLNFAFALTHFHRPGSKKSLKNAAGNIALWTVLKLNLA